MRLLTAVLALLLLAAKPAPAQTPPVLGEADVAALSQIAIFGPDELRPGALGALMTRGKPDVAAALVLATRFRRGDPAALIALSSLTGEDIESWEDAMLWQEANPQIVPHPSFRQIKLDIFQAIDPAFMRFLDGDRSKRENMRIRLEEITWGGVKVDGIPSLDNPAMVPAVAAGYLRDDDLVFGVEINGDIRAYPLRIMGWHEMFNDVIGGVPVALAYCTLCGAGILFETQVEGRAEPFVFGSSGFLYRSNKLMFDRQTDSLWNQFTGEPVVGPLVGSGITLNIRPVSITSWGAWKARNPQTTVLSLETGHNRDYGSGVVYRDYFASPDLMFPALVRDESQVRRKDYVYGIRTVGAARAWPLDAFAKEPVINDAVGGQQVVLIGDADSRTVRAYARRGQTFAAADAPGRLKGPGGDWTVAEDALTGPDGSKLARLPGHISYWFAWDGYLGVDSTLYPE